MMILLIAGIDCYGNEREALMEQGRFFNNKLLSDVVIVLENEKFFAHKFVLVRCSQVFERMFTSKQWDSHKEKVMLLTNYNIRMLHVKIILIIYL